MGGQQMVVVGLKANANLIFTRHSSFLQRGRHLTLNRCQAQGKTALSYLRLRACADVEGSQSHNNQNGDGKRSQLWHLAMVKVAGVAMPVLNFANNNFLPLALITGVIVGLVNPVPGCLAQKYSLSKWSTCGIFLISGLTLQSGEMSAALQAWPVGVFGLVSILLCTPIFSTLVLQLKLAPQEFVTGLAVFCCMPTTLSSGVALTQSVGGNSALALVLTVASNLLGILTVPFILSKLVAQEIGVSIPAKQLLRSLTLTLLVPLLLGKGIRNSFHGVERYVDQRRRLFSKLNSIFLSLVPWMQVSGSNKLLLTVSPISFVIAISIGTGLHIVFLAWNTIMAWSLSLNFGGRTNAFGKKENARSVIIVASQKTLPVMVAIVGQLGEALGQPGLLVIPCVAAHIIQIILDSYIVNLWLWEDEKALNFKGEMNQKLS